MKIQDKFGRTVSYLRVAVTDRCNFRCNYCMPNEGIDFVNRKQLLSYEEIFRLVRVFVDMGVQKLRITGGEPFVRKDLSKLLEAVSQLEGLQSLHITTNGTLIDRYLHKLESWRVKSVNVSLDSLQSDRFFKITQRDEFDRVINCIDKLQQLSLKLKINMVVQSGVNTDEILEFAHWTKDRDVEVRFIEEMPFNGNQGFERTDYWDFKKILQLIRDSYPGLQEDIRDPNASSFQYLIPGHKGRIGVIPAYSRSLCGTCNRARITPEGWLKVCLYDQGVFNLRDFIRNGADDQQISEIIKQAFYLKKETGFQTEKGLIKNSNIRESMARIGG